MNNDFLTNLGGHKYINLETYKKNGNPVQTPVWFVIDNGVIYVTTMSSTGKVKRLQNNQNVRIMPCGFKGESKGEWVSGRAHFVDKVESEQAMKLRKKKYGFQARLVSILRATKGSPIVFAIKI